MGVVKSTINNVTGRIHDGLSEKRNLHPKIKLRKLETLDLESLRSYVILTYLRQGLQHHSTLGKAQFAATRRVVKLSGIEKRQFSVFVGQEKGIRFAQQTLTRFACKASCVYYFYFTFYNLPVHDTLKFAIPYCDINPKFPFSSFLLFKGVYPL